MKPKLLLWMIAPAVLLILVTRYIADSSAEELPNFTDLPQYTLATVAKNEIDQVRQELIASFEWKRGGVVSFWFDDAWMSQYTEGYKLLADYGYKGSLAVPTGLLKYEGYIKWWQIKKLQFEGWEISANSVSHECDPDVLTADSLEYELRYSKIEILSHGLLADNYVAPCGVTNEALIALAKTYYKSMRTSEPGINSIPVGDPYFIKANAIFATTTIDDIRGLLTEAKLARGWLVLMFHQIDDSGGEYAVTPEFFQEIVAEVSKSDLQVALPTQVITIK